MGYVKYDCLHQFCVDILCNSGVPVSDAEIIADSIDYAHRSGNGTHGVVRLPIYLNKIKKGLMKADTPITIIKDKRVITVIDANHGFGQVAGIKGMHISIEKAQEYGLGLVNVRHSNNFGTAGFIAQTAVKKGMIGIVMANSAPAIAPTGGNKPIFGTNPIAFSFPAPEGHHPIVLDMATSAAARGKIRLAARNGEKIPLGWALDINGQPTDDPNEALKGSMIPIGGHKGYGLSMVIDLLAGLLSGAGFGGGVNPLNIQEDYSNNGHMLIALDISCFMEIDEYYEKVTHLIHNTINCGDPGKVFIPGDPALYPASQVSDSMFLKQDLVNELNLLAEVTGSKNRIFTYSEV